MNEQLKDLLLEHYGELQYEYEHTVDYFVRGQLIDKMNCINVLLSLPKVKRTYISDILKDGGLDVPKPNLSAAAVRAKKKSIESTTKEIETK